MCFKPETGERVLFDFNQLWVYIPLNDSSYSFKNGIMLFAVGFHHFIVYPCWK